MPTPSEVTVSRTPPLDATSSRASFASCPPEDDCEHHAPREERVDTPQPSVGTTVDGHMTTQEATPEPDAPTTTTRPLARTPSHDDAPEKGEHVEDAGIAVEDLHSSSVGSPDAVAGPAAVSASESEARLLAQSLSKADISSSPSSLPQYLTFPRSKDRVRL